MLELKSVLDEVDAVCTEVSLLFTARETGSRVKVLLNWCEAFSP